MLIRKKIAVVLLAILVFTAGVQAGNGGLTFNRSVSNQNKGLPANLDYKSVESIYDELRAKYDGKLDVDKLMDGLKQGLVAASGDPYTEYMSASEAEQFAEQLSGSFEGIGAELGKEKEAVIIVAPLADTPAQKAGLRPKDVIFKIDGKDAIGLSVDAAKNKIRGAAGTKVTLTIIRDGKEIDFTITRATISIASVEHKMLDGNIGLITVTRFSDDTTSLVREAANEFKKANVRGVVLDLRGNPGGYLESAVGVASVWLNNRKVVDERREGVVFKTYQSSGTATLENVPTVVLIDEGSASASEIVAGALKDAKAATLIGTKSFGKGSVQQPQELNDGGLLKITVARWFTPSGLNIDKQGIKPDKEVNRTEADYKANKDPQLDAALDKLKTL